MKKLQNIFEKVCDQAIETKMLVIASKKSSSLILGDRFPLGVALRCLARLCCLVLPWVALSCLVSCLCLACVLLSLCCLALCLACVLFSLCCLALSCLALSCVLLSWLACIRLLSLSCLAFACLVLPCRGDP